MLLRNGKNTIMQLKKLNQLEKYVLNRRNIEQQIYKEQMRSNMKLNKINRPIIPLKSKTKIGMQLNKRISIKNKPIVPVTLPTMKPRSIKPKSMKPIIIKPKSIKPSSVKLSSSSIKPIIASRIIVQEPLSTDKISMDDINNIDSEIRSSTLSPPLYYESPPPPYQIEDAAPAIKTMSMVDYDDTDALSYTDEDLEYRD